MEELEKKVLQEKFNGLSDLEIAKKYRVSLRFIEKVITKSSGVNISNLSKFNKVKKIRAFSPSHFKEEWTTLWSFKNRGNWATHSSEYRGNWSPYIPRNIILKYSKPGELVLDYFCGGGTTAIEAKLLSRKFIGIDINPKAIEMAKRKVDFEVPKQLFNYEIFEPELKVGDARDLSFLSDNSVDLICSHPPYANIIHYTNLNEGDLSFLEVDQFLDEMSKVAKESYRVLKPSKKCAILIGDIRKKGFVIPLGFKLLDVYLNAGFKLREIVIKQQHNCKTTGIWYNKSLKYNFLLLAHEYLLVFEKPLITKDEEYTPRISIVEKEAEYNKEIDKLETTTVWIFPKENFNEKLIGNITKRYSNFIYFELFFDEKSQNTLNDVKRFLLGKLENLSNNGFLVIQTKDVRINGHIEPLAKRIVDLLSNEENLHLKEIIILSTNKQNKNNSKGITDYLEIVHQYLLVYEVNKKC